MAKDKPQPDSGEPERPARPAAKPRAASPKKDRVRWARINRKAYVRRDPGSKPMLLPKGSEIQILESEMSKIYMTDITAEKAVEEKEKERRQKAIAKANAELDAEDAAGDA